MKKCFRAIVAVLCIVCMIASTVPATFAAKENDNHLLYGRKQLQKTSDSNSYTNAYDRIVEGIANREESIILEEYNINRDELGLIMSLYKNDPHPHFWLGNAYSVSGYSDGTVYALMPLYNDLGTVSDEEFKKEVDTYNAAIDSIIKKAGIRNGMDQYEIELRVHDALVGEVDYVSTPNAHNSYGAIVEKKAVCQGYTLAFNYILRLCGIEAHYVAGKSRDIAHSWSLVSINGNYYYTDVTWDDPIGTVENCHEVFHSYFNLTEKEIKKDHVFNDPGYELPSCESKTDSYYAHNPSRVMTANPDVNLVASFFKNGSASVYVPEEHASSFIIWFSSNISDIAKGAGYDLSAGISYVYASSGNEYHLIIDGVLNEPDISVLLGDVDGDGSITSIDSNILRRIVSGSVSATEINLLGGDIDRDGKLTSMDSNLLKRLIAGN